jgi:hypothetical protein
VYGGRYYRYPVTYLQYFAAEERYRNYLFVAVTCLANALPRSGFCCCSGSPRALNFSFWPTVFALDLSPIGVVVVAAIVVGGGGAIRARTVGVGTVNAVVRVGAGSAVGDGAIGVVVGDGVIGVVGGLKLVCRWLHTLVWPRIYHPLLSRLDVLAFDGSRRRRRTPPQRKEVRRRRRRRIEKLVVWSLHPSKARLSAAVSSHDAARDDLRPAATPP